MTATSADRLVSALDEAGYRLTRPRRAIAGLIAERGGHFTAAELYRTARKRRLGIGRATVFRSLEALDQVGAIERLDLPTGEHAYVRCDAAHHHHVICSRCGTSVDVGDLGLATPLAEASRRTGFRIDAHRLELFGLCPSCRAADAPR